MSSSLLVTGISYQSLSHAAHGRGTPSQQSINLSTVLFKDAAIQVLPTHQELRLTLGECGSPSMSVLLAILWMQQDHRHSTAFRTITLLGESCEMLTFRSVDLQLAGEVLSRWGTSAEESSPLTWFPQRSPAFGSPQTTRVEQRFYRNPRSAHAPNPTGSRSQPAVRGY